MLRRVAVVSEPLSVPELLAAVADPAAGGQALFVGVVRDHDEGRPVTGLDYEAHPGAPDELALVAGEVARRPGIRAVAVEHRVGPLAVGDAAVIVAVAAEHRGQALEACRALIDELKARVPIWKRQHHPDGSSGWVNCP